MASSDIIAVARAVRAPMKEAKFIIPAFCTLQLRDSDPVTVLNFITGAFTHQSRVEEKSKWFSVTIASVERYSRKTGSKELGQKVRITFEEKTPKGDAAEYIDTGWVRFLGSEDPDDMSDPTVAWEVAHSLSIEEDALALIGKKVSVCKSYIETDKPLASGGTEVKFIADLHSSSKQDESDSGRGSKSRSSDEASAALARSDIKDICKDLNVKYDEDLDDLMDVASWEGKATDIALSVADAARISKKDETEFVDFFIDQHGTPQERAVLALIEWR